MQLGVRLHPWIRYRLHRFHHQYHRSTNHLHRDYEQGCLRQLLHLLMLKFLDRLEPYAQKRWTESASSSLLILRWNTRFDAREVMEDRHLREHHAGGQSFWTLYTT